MATKVVKKKRAGKKSGRTARPTRRDRKEKAVEIVFSYDEIDFLRKITGKQFKSSPGGGEGGARLSLRDKLLDISLDRANALGGGLIVVELTRPELALLQRITKEVYSFITSEERRARLILREKILIAAEKVSGKRTKPDDA